MFGANTSGSLRGDYSRARKDFTIDQDMRLYSADDQAMWRNLYSRQSRIVQGYACAEFLDGLKLLNAADRIPQLERISDALHARTGWRLAAVPGFIPDVAFFQHLSERRLPVTVWLRKPEEMDYLVEPDMFHDFFGHVPMLFHPVFADYVQLYGKRGLEAAGDNALPLLARLYLVHRGVRADRHRRGSAHVRLRHHLVRWRNAVLADQHRAASGALRAHAGHAHALHDRRLPEDLLRGALARGAASRGR